MAKIAALPDRQMLSVHFLLKNISSNPCPVMDEQQLTDFLILKYLSSLAGTT